MYYALAEMGAVEANESGSDKMLVWNSARERFEFPCFHLVQELRESPIEIASRMAKHISPDWIIFDVTPDYGFLHIRLNPAARLAISQTQKEEEKSMVKVASEVQVYEVNGKERTPGDEGWPNVTVKSHWNYDKFVIICVDGKEYTVGASDLETATRNAQNSNRHG